MGEREEGTGGTAPTPGCVGIGCIHVEAWEEDQTRHTAATACSIMEQSGQNHQVSKYTLTQGEVGIIAERGWGGGEGRR